MKILVALSMGMAIAGAGVALAASETMSNIPSNSVTVTDWYKQNVYDSQNNKIGSIDDVLVSKDGKIEALILSADGKDVAVSFDTIKQTMKDNKNYLTMNADKDSFKSAPAFKYDKNTTTWVRDTSKDEKR
jgi:hypothetical protein